MPIALEASTYVGEASKYGILWAPNYYIRRKVDRVHSNRRCVGWDGVGVVKAFDGIAVGRVYANVSLAALR